ncbi:SHOCT domain-containing protein [Thiothrix litoralis]|uniref:SHOCT domain-containing protein n=2 Tax=Thiothrix litoralis TaxID=2891210 RepID=A0ABX7WW15_9GAMM|nr:SHOCT domain-containing protein [Thiothrix litoralis]QTR47810.1 SHOCT domain-containing protein [Thiothrix litoralis]
MQAFTNHGQNVINDLAQRYGLSKDAVTNMLYAVMNGNGTMAQFNIPELGGGGQWMQGGMTMVGDMFNYGLKTTVNNLCAELSNLLSSQNPAMFQPPVSSQSQYQGNGQQQNSNNGQNSLFVANPSGYGNWWQADLGQASSSGAQNNIRYAYFPSTQRLALEINGHVTIYDTLDNQIGGVSQQQSGSASLTFTSQYGLVQVENLPIISIDGVAQQPKNQAPVQNNPFTPPPVSTPAPAQNLNNTNVSESDIFALIEKLADLKQKGILSDEEFATKKAELLQRL